MNVGIEQTIEQVERLYVAVTGKPPPAPNGPQTPIPPEVDAAQHVEEQLGRLLNLLGQSQGTQPTETPWVPPVVAWEDDQALTIAIEIPGVPRESVDVQTSENLITVKGMRPAPWGQSKRNPLPGTTLVERPIGPFQRVLAVPVRRVNLEQLTAELRDGVLEIRIPRSPQSATTARQIQIK
jgi:HSP20 family protein